MAQLKWKTSSIIVIVVLLIASFLPVLPMAAGQNDPSDNHTVNHQTKWWNVTDSRTFTANTVIIMENQNVTVKNGGTLTLDHSKLMFTNTVNGIHGLLVEKGGTLILKNKSTLTGNGSKSFFCNFSAGSNVLIKSSVVSNVSVYFPYWDENVGIFSESTNVTIESSLLENNTWTDPLITVNASGKVVIKNSTLKASTEVAISAFDGSNVTLFNDKLMKVGTAWGSLYAVESSVEYRNSEVVGFLYGIDIEYTTIYLNNNKIHNCTQAGFYMYHSTAELIKNEFNNDWHGIETEGKVSLNMHDGNWFHHNTKESLSLSAGTTLTSKLDKFQGTVNSRMIMADTSALTFEKDQFAPNNDIAIMAEFSSTVKVTDSTFTKGGGNNLQGLGVVYSTDVDIVRCTFTDINTIIGAGYNSHIMMKDSKMTNFDSAFVITDGTTLESINNTMTNGVSGFYLGNFASGSSTNDKFTGNLAFGGGILQASDDSSMDIRGLTGSYANTDTVFVSCYGDSTVNIIDSPFYIQSAKEFMSLTHDVHVRSINSSLKITDNVEYNGYNGMIDIGWHVNVQTQWQNSAPAPGAFVSYKDTKGQMADGFTTDASGAHSLDMIQYTMSRTGTVNHNPYDFAASLAGMTGGNSTSITNNVPAASPLVIKLTDAAKPVINITSPATNWRTKDGKFVMNGTASDIGSGIAKVQVNNGTGWKDVTGKDLWQYEWNLTEGTYKLEAQVTDLSGLKNSTSINVTVDTTPPTLVVTEPSVLYEPAHLFYVNGTTDGVNVTVDNVGIPIVAGNFSKKMTLADGPQDIIVVATDDVGNKVTVTRHVIVDTIPPMLTSNVVNGTYVKVASLHLSGTTNGDTVSINGKPATLDKLNLTWAIDLPLVEGKNGLTIKAMDLAGHATILSMTVILDTVPPGLLVTAPSGVGPMYTNKAVLTIAGKVTNATSLMMGTTAITIGTGGNFTKDVTLVAGENRITLVAKDQAGNAANWTYTAILDTKVPTVQITSPGTGLKTNVASVVVSGTVDDTTATLKFGTTAVVNSNGTFSFTATLTAGANTIRVNATDAAGNWAIATVTVTYDNTPSLTLTAPKKTSISTTDQSVLISGTSEPGAKIYINDAAITTNPDGSFSYTYVLKMGKNTVDVRSVDPAGNTKVSSFTATRSDPTQYDTMALAGLGIVLLIVGLLIGLVIGRMMAGPKAVPASEDEDEEEEESEEDEEKSEDEEEEEEDEEEDEKESEDEEKDEKEPEEDEKEPKEEEEEEEESEDEEEDK